MTGANQGFGYGLTKLLLRRGHEVVMACRNISAAKTATENILKWNKSSTGKLVAMKLDLADLSSVVEFSKEFEEKYSGRILKYLVLNAGIVKLSREVSKQGIELTYQTNHFGGVALFNLLLPRVLLPSKSRVVFVGSLVHANGKFEIGKSDLTGVDGPFSGVQYYNNSKLLNSLYAFQVNKRFSQNGITCNSVHPGSGLFTNLGRGEISCFTRAAVASLLTIFYPVFWLIGN